MTGHRTRPAHGSDAPAVADLERLCFGADAWTPAQVAEELTGPGRRAWVLEAESGGLGPGPDSGEACLDGYVCLRDAGDVVDLQRIAVRPSLRRRGAARVLLAVARPVGVPLLLEVSTLNAAARAFYAREGFVEIDRRRRYYRDGSDALILSRWPVSTERDG